MYTLISQDKFRRCVGTIGTKPTHNFWTLVPYLGGLIKEFHDVETDTWIESATAEEMDELNKVEVPQTISMMDLRIQLVLIDKPIDNIIQMIKSLPKEYLDEKQKQIILIKLEFANYFERSSPELNQLVPIVGITQDDLDNIFINGNKK